MSQRLPSGIVLREAYAAPEGNAQQTRQQKAARTRAVCRHEEQVANKAITAAASSMRALFLSEMVVVVLTICSSSNGKGQCCEKLE
jgi:hypothetical protein